MMYIRFNQAEVEAVGMIAGQAQLLHRQSTAAYFPDDSVTCARSNKAAIFRRLAFQ